MGNKLKDLLNGLKILKIGEEDVIELADGKCSNSTCEDRCLPTCIPDLEGTCEQIT